MKNTVTILGKEYELFWSTKAMSDISEMCGGLKNLREWIYGKNEDDTAGILKRFTDVLETLVNAAILRDNFAVRNGFTQGAEKNTFTHGDLAMVLSLDDMTNMISKVYGALHNDTDYEIPPDAKIEKKEVDETLTEIQEQRRKKEESGE